MRTLIGVAALVLVVGALTAHVPRAGADTVDCSRVKCVALTFDDGPGPHTDRLLQVLADNDARSTFFPTAGKVAADPAAARRIADAGMEVANHTWDHPDLTTIAPEAISEQLRRANDTIAAATGVTPTLYRPPFGFTNDAVRAAAKELGMAEILWDVVPFDWINDTNTAATTQLLKAQVRPGSVVLLHDTFASTVDVVSQFLPLLRANGYHAVTVSHLLGARAPGSSYGGRDNGSPANDIRE